VTSIQNECKELLFFCEKGFQIEPTITATNVTDKVEIFSFKYSDERTAEITFSDPLRFVYEPNASLLKSGAFKILGTAFKLSKLHPNTHLFTSSTLIDQFPGRIFQIEAKVKLDPKRLLDYFEEGKANIFTRNYPLTVDEIRKRSRLKDGGDKFLIGCSGRTEKLLLAGKQVK
jgi:hypothetical protein